MGGGSMFRDKDPCLEKVSPPERCLMTPLVSPTYIVFLSSRKHQLLDYKRITSLCTIDGGVSGVQGSEIIF